MKKISVNCGGVIIGDGSISIQSMTNTKTENVSATVKQIEELQKAKCDIVRVTVNDEAAAKALKEIVKNVTVPIVADIHFNPSLAVKAVEAGAHKVRINPGNFPIGELKTLVDVCLERNVPIRVGVNAGSIAKQYKNLPICDGLVSSVLDSVKRIEDLGFGQMVLSVKSSDVRTCIKAYEKLFEISRYPLHIGITEAGTFESGLIKNSIGIGALLLKGIGDTVRVSLSDEPVKEVYAARKILSALGIKKEFEVIACPTCGRTSINVSKFAKAIENEFCDCKTPLKVAVMGCVVNGIGESEGADVGIAGGKEKSVIFVDGKAVDTVSNDVAFECLKKRIIEKIDAFNR